MREAQYKFVGLVLVCGALLCAFKQMEHSNNIFYAHLQGWYPTNPQSLRNTMQELDKIAEASFGANLSPVRCMIAPHAGYAYSGDVAVAAYRLLKGSVVRRVIVLAPSHRVPFAGIAIPAFELYETPLGSVKIDQAIIKQLKSDPLFVENQHVYRVEHSFEMQLPLIQTYLPQAAVVPLIVGELSLEQIRNVATALIPFIDLTTLVVVSSDFTHYGKKFGYTPVHDFIQQRIMQLDSGALQAIQNYSMESFLSYVSKTGATICGRTPIAILVTLLKQGVFGDVVPQLVAYKTSAEITGQKDESVSYVGMVFVERRAQHVAQKDQLTMYDKRALLACARATLQQLFEKKLPQELSYPIITKQNSKQQGVFVTLYKKGLLRGCIGRTTTQDPIYKSVIAMTRASALEDSRFSPVTAAELPDLTISISVLTDPKPIKSYKDIVIGRDGIIVTQGTQTALFLPHVATEFGWDLPTTLSQLSKKAGLPADAWKKGDVQFEVFEAVDFSEAEFVNGITAKPSLAAQSAGLSDVAQDGRSRKLSA